MKRNDYTVVVGNIGTIYSGNNRRIATRIWEQYRTASIYGWGKASGEFVVLMVNGEVERDYAGTQAA